MTRIWFFLLLGGCIPPRPDLQSGVDADTSVRSESLSAARAWYLQAVVAEARGDDALAEGNLLLTAGMDERSPWPRAKLAEFYERQRRWVDAELAWNQCLRLGPIWEAHAGLARIRGRADDEQGELDHLASALALGGSVDVHARLFELQRDRGVLPDAMLTLRAWQQLDASVLTSSSSMVGQDPGLALLRRARAARSVLDHKGAMADLLRAAEHGRGSDVAPLIVDIAARSCRWADAYSWALEADLHESEQRRVAALVASAVGDVALLERTSQISPQLPQPSLHDHQVWLAPSVDVDGAAGDALRVAEAWSRAGHADRGLRIAGDVVAAFPRLEWAKVVAARSSVQLGQPGKARRLLSGVSNPAGLALSLELGLVTPEQMIQRLDEDDVTALDEALAHAESRGAQALPVRAYDGQALQAADGVLQVPAQWLTQWSRAHAWRAIDGALRRDDRVVAMQLSAQWTRSNPDDSYAWLARSLAETDGVNRADHLDRALKLDPCLSQAWLARADAADPVDAMALWQRAYQADPLSGAVRDARPAP